MYKSPIQQQFELARKQALIKQGLLDEDGNQPTNPYLQELAQLNEKPSIFSHRNDDINAPAIDHAEPLWENVWFENECACIFGDPNIGKSTLAFQIACNVADSGRNVIYFDFENMMHQYHSRSWAPEQFIKPDNLLIDHFAQDTTFEQMTDRRLILDHIEQEFLKLNAPVIIIDDITQICPMRNNRKTHRVLRRLRQWLNQYHVSILVIAHASHHHEGTPLAMKHLTGDRQLAYAFDSIISLNDIPAGTTADGATHYIKQLKARNAPIQIHNEAVTTLKLKDRFDDEACQLLAKKYQDKGYDQETIQQQLGQQRGRKFFYFLTMQEKASENQLLFLPLEATPEQRLTFIHDTFAKGWSIRTIAAHCCTPKTTVHRLLATPKPSFNSPSILEGDTGGVCQEEKGNTSPSKIDLDDTVTNSPSKIEGVPEGRESMISSSPKVGEVPQRGGGVCQEEKGNNSPSKIDQWCKPNADVELAQPMLRCSPLPLKEGARGSMNSPLPLKELVTEGRGSMNTSPSKIDLDDTVTNSPSKIEGVPEGRESMISSSPKIEGVPQRRESMISSSPKVGEVPQRGGGVCQEEKGKNSPSKIDLDDTVTSSPSKIEGARGSMNSPLPLKERDTGGVCPTELNEPEQCNNNSCSGSNEVVNEQLTESCVKKGEKVHVLGDKVADKIIPRLRGFATPQGAALREEINYELLTTGCRGHNPSNFSPQGSNF